MNKIFISRKSELQSGYFVIPFACSDLANVDTELSHLDRSDLDNRKIADASVRIRAKMLTLGYEVEFINYRNMSISAQWLGV